MSKFQQDKRFKHAVRILLLVAGGSFVAPAHAITYTVTTLDAGPGAGCAGVVCPTLNDALTAVNALPASTTDDVLIQFEASLNGDIKPNAGTPRMFSGALGNTAINDYLGQGAFYHVNAQLPVTVDFGNRVGVVQQDDGEYAALYIQSNNVIVENFQNAAKRDISGAGGYADAAGIMGGASGIVIGGSIVIIRNGLTSDPGTIAMEACIGLVDGATNVLIEDYYCRSSALFGIYFDERSETNNIVLNRYEAQGNRAYGDIFAEFGAADDKTIVNGLTVTDSEFRAGADPVDRTIQFRENSVINNLKISNSRFLSEDTPTVYVWPTAELGTASITNNTATNTRTFFNATAGVIHSGALTIKNNIITGMGGFGILLQSEIHNALIDSNQFLNPRDETAAGETTIYVTLPAFGTNNVISNNFFASETVLTDIEMIWIDASPGRDIPTGWSVLNNAIVNIQSNTSPIYNSSDGYTLISGNTFSGTKGAPIDDTSPETGGVTFVVNTDSFSNGKIQTWRPTGATYTGSTVRVQVAPVDPPLAGNAAPTGPVSIDVYYTATDKAETYLGRIPGTFSAETVYEFTSNATGGAVRAQITDALGRSSQYSAAVAVQQALDSGADNDQDGLPNGAECTINLLGILLACEDTDGDGNQNYLDNDDDDDGIPTLVECSSTAPCVDTDGDGKANNLDLDSDADGISDKQECPEQACRDTDGDGAANYIDIDSDGDGLEDNVECPDASACLDVDGNSTEDYLEAPAPIIVRGTGGGALGHWMLMLFGGLALLRRRALLPLAAVLGLSASFNAQADGYDWTSRFYGGAMAGGLFTDFDDKELTQALQAQGYNVTAESTNSDKLGYGLWVGYALNTWLGVELSYTTGADEEVRYSGSAGSDMDAVLAAAAPHLKGYGDSYLARLRYHYALSDNWFLSPRVGLGITQTRESVRNRNKASDSEQSFTWAVGSGIQYALTDDWSVGAEADYYQGSSDNAYAVIAGVVEWRFPSALGLKQYVVPPPAVLPVEVVPVDVAPAPEPAPTPAVDLSKIKLDGVVFESSSAQLTADSLALLGNLVPALQSTLQAAPDLHVEVAGHTDASGSEPRNVQLSQARAQAVQDFLIGHGIDAARLSAKGYGSSKPVAPNDTPQGRSQNRRVELLPLP